MKLADLLPVLTAFGVLAGGLAGCGWIGTTVYRMFFGGEERRANAAIALTGAAKVLVDELQEEVAAARAESRLARAETKAAREETAAARRETATAREEVELLRRNVNEMRHLTELEIARLKKENAELRQQLNGRP